FHTAYHPLVTLVQNDAPATYGSEGKRLDCRQVKSPYNSKRQAPRAWADLIAGIRPPYLLASTSDEAIMPSDQVMSIMRERGYVGSVAIPHERYIGSQVGIHNGRGEKVGTAGKKMNTEYLVLCGPTQSVVESALSAARRQLSVPKIAR